MIEDTVVNVWNGLFHDWPHKLCSTPNRSGETLYEALGDNLCPAAMSGLTALTLVVVLAAAALLVERWVK